MCPVRYPAAALLSYSCLSITAMAALQGSPTPPYLHRQALPAGAALTPATAQPWGGGGQHLGPGAMGKTVPVPNQPGWGKKPLEFNSCSKSPGRRKGRCGMWVCSAGRYFSSLAGNREGLSPQSSTTFFYRAFKRSQHAYQNPLQLAAASIFFIPFWLF